MTPIADFYVHTAGVETFQGETGYGKDSFAAVVNKAGFFDGTSKLVRDKDGQQVVANATWYTDPADASLYQLDSRVTVQNVIGRVVAVGIHTSGSLGLPDNLAVELV